MDRKILVPLAITKQFNLELAGNLLANFYLAYINNLRKTMERPI